MPSLVGEDQVRQTPAAAADVPTAEPAVLSGMGVGRHHGRTAGTGAEVRATATRTEVGRPRLARRLDRLPGGGLGLVIAPAGSGKSVLVRQWVQGVESVDVACVQLDSRHDDAVAFMRDLLGALALSPEMAGGLLQQVPVGGSRLGTHFLEALRDILTELRHDVVLVLEDLHRITNAALVADLGLLAGRLPPNLRLVVTSRWDPPWSLHRAGIDGQLVELRGEDLAFGPLEARALLSSVSGCELTDEQVDLLVERTDGWAVGLQLAGIALQDSDDVDRVVASFAGSDRLVAEYLIEEVLDRQDPELRHFLLQTSILDWFTPELCDAVTGNSSARDHLAEIERRSLFLVPLDPRREHYRYHHLFADLLRYRLRRDGLAEEHRFHRSAAAWLLAHGHSGDAVPHLLAAGDHDGAYRVISTAGHEWFERGESATLVQWLGALVDGYGGPDAAPAGACLNLLAAQVAADESTAAAETRRRLVRRDDLTAGERVAADACHAQLVFRELPPSQVLRAARSVLDTLPDVGPGDVPDFLGLGGWASVEIMALYAEGWAHFLLGDHETAEQVLRVGLDRPGVEYPMWRIYVQGALALVCAWRGRCSEAASLATGAIGIAERFGTSRHEALTSPYLALGLVHIDRLETEAAALNLARAADENRGRLSSFVFIDLHRVINARLLALTEGPERALAALGAPSACVVEAPLVIDANRSLECQLLVAAGDLVAARVRLGDVGPVVGRLGAARVSVALAGGDIAGARQALDGWGVDRCDVRASITHDLQEAAILDADGHHAAARLLVGEAVARAGGELLRWPFLEVPAALGLVRQSPRAHPKLLDPLANRNALTLRTRAAAQERLVEPLTERELAVLGHLPSRTRNQEIAAALYISVNTLKSHLRNIYRKLEVADRDEAVRRAAELGLL